MRLTLSLFLYSFIVCALATSPLQSRDSRSLSKQQRILGKLGTKDAKRHCPPDAIRNAWDNKGAWKRTRTNDNEVRTEYEVIGGFLGTDAVIAEIVPRHQGYESNVGELNNLWRVGLLLGYGLKMERDGPAAFFIVRKDMGIDEIQTKLKGSKLRKLKESAKQRTEKDYGMLPVDFWEFEFKKKPWRLPFTSWVATPIDWMVATSKGCPKKCPHTFTNICFEIW